MAGHLQALAETEGFEPSVRVNPVRRFSKPLVSATHPRLRLRRSGAIAGALAPINGDARFGPARFRFALPRVHCGESSIPANLSIRIKGGIMGKSFVWGSAA